MSEEKKLQAWTVSTLKLFENQKKAAITSASPTWESFHINQFKFQLAAYVHNLTLSFDFLKDPERFSSLLIAAYFIKKFSSYFSKEILLWANQLYKSLSYQFRDEEDFAIFAISNQVHERKNLKNTAINYFFNEMCLEKEDMALALIECDKIEAMLTPLQLFKLIKHYVANVEMMSALLRKKTTVFSLAKKDIQVAATLFANADWLDQASLASILSHNKQKIAKIVQEYVQKNSDEICKKFLFAGIVEHLFLAKTSLKTIDGFSDAKANEILEKEFGKNYRVNLTLKRVDVSVALQEAIGSVEQNINQMAEENIYYNDFKEISSKLSEFVNNLKHVRGEDSQVSAKTYFPQCDFYREKIDGDILEMKTFADKSKQTQEVTMFFDLPNALELQTISDTSASETFSELSVPAS